LEENKYNVYTTTSAESVREFARDVLLPSAKDGVVQLVLTLCGDGGIADIVNVLSSNGPYERLVNKRLSALFMLTKIALYTSRQHFAHCL